MAWYLSRVRAGSRFPRAGGGFQQMHSAWGLLAESCELCGLNMFDETGFTALIRQYFEPGY